MFKTVNFGKIIVCDSDIARRFSNFFVFYREQDQTKMDLLTNLGHSSSSLLQKNFLRQAQGQPRRQFLLQKKDCRISQMREISIIQR